VRTEDIRKRRKQILKIARRHGAMNIRVFGLDPPEEAGPDSPVHFLVRAGRKTTPWFPGGLVADLGDLLGCRVLVATESGLNESYRKEVLSDAVPV